MKMKMQDLVFLYETLNKIADMPILEDAPIETKFKLVRNVREIQSYYTDFIKSRQELLIKNSSVSEEDSEKRIATVDQLKYINDEVDKLCNVEVDVAVIPVTLKELEALKLDMVGLSGLYPIISDGEA